MDKQFDILTLGMAGGIPRRQVLRGLLAGFGAACLSAVAPRWALAADCPTGCACGCTIVTGSGKEIAGYFCGGDKCCECGKVCCEIDGVPMCCAVERDPNDVLGHDICKNLKLNPTLKPQCV